MKKQLTGHPLMVVAPLLLGILLQPAFGSAQSPPIRLAVVPAPVDTGLLQELVPDFQAQTGYRVEVYSRPDLANLFAAARMGWADLIISHYGHPEVESFMTGGFGLWPHTVFANQSAVIGPREDPAQIRGLSDAAEALRRIIASGSRFVTTRTPTPKSIEQVLLASIGASPRGDWYLDLGLQGDAAFPVADRLGAYTIFGLQPFLTWQEKCSPLDARITGPGGQAVSTTPKHDASPEGNYVDHSQKPIGRNRAAKSPRDRCEPSDTSGADQAGSGDERGLPRGKERFEQPGLGPGARKPADAALPQLSS
ncbi:MAG: hypothetical protein HYS05_13165 [Acidobacteria bacterium]|nr:hypothetical protein [Acidobacteriota bacterium]